MRVTKIEGIGPAFAEKLIEQGIRTTEKLLESGAQRKGRKDLAGKTGIPEKTILNWVNRADLMRIPGVGEEYSDLLEAAGVDTVRELGNRRPENLHATMLEINASKRLVRRTPALSDVQRWVKSAKKMVAVVTY